MLYCRRTAFSKSILVWVRPTTPSRRPTSPPIFSMASFGFSTTSCGFSAAARALAFAAAVFATAAVFGAAAVFAAAAGVKDYDVPAKDRDGLALLGHADVAADHRKVGLVPVDRSRGGGGPGEHVDAKPDVGAVARQLRGNRLRHLGVLAARRANREAQRLGLRYQVIDDAGNAGVHQQGGGADQQGVPHHDAGASRPALAGRLRAQGVCRRRQRRNERF
jgi:hypothetical protein